MAKVAKIDAARIKREQTTKVYDCGKCGSQGARLDGNGHISCGGMKCDARWAADWYEPTDSKTKAKYSRPRLKESDALNVYHCGYCLFPFFHIQSDGSITCYRETCRRKALFRWAWLEGLGAA